MPRIEIELNSVTHITADAIGPPGKRVFYLQGHQEERVVTLIIEKIQLQSLSVGVEQFLANLVEKFPDLEDAVSEYNEELMHIHPPLDPVFRVGEVGLGYDSAKDLVVVIAKELMGEEQDPEELGVVRYWCTRAQLRALSHWGMELSSRGRPICSQCNQPEEPEGHFCVKKNGGHRSDEV